MAKPVVSIVKSRDIDQSVREAVELCGGLQGMNKNDGILIKPNLVDWEFDLPFPPYGVVTTTALVFALVRLLAEEGFSRITVGEAPLPVPKSKGRQIYQALGYEKLKERYGVELVDFNEEKFVPVDFGGYKLNIAQKALEAHRLINLPVLKTHNLCRVSLGLKNLKGCLDRKSKILCHGRDHDLDQMFPAIADKLPPGLTIVDGIYTLERGPAPYGKAYRKDLLIASRDTFACDVVASEVMGHPAREVPHLENYAGISGRSLDTADIEVRGRGIGEVGFSLAHDWDWEEDDTGPLGFKKRGITGIAVRKYDKTLCTGCSGMYNPMLIMIMSAFKGQPFPGVEVITGKVRMAGPGFEKTVLFGKCICDLNKDNPNIKKAVQVKGCPPDLKNFEKVMQAEGIDCKYEDYVKYRGFYLKNNYSDKEIFDMGLYVMQ
ncbi:MAG: DUF362 domain-containing protein [Bacillota bacterium]